jgi:autotransporter-associated beta strand protein
MKYCMVLAASLAAVAVTGSAVRADLFWDVNSTNAGSSDDGVPNGTWDAATTTNWTTDGTNGTAATQVWDGTGAIFSAGGGPAGSSYTVNVANAVSATGITFNDVLVTVASTGGTLTLTSPAGISIPTATNAATINAPIAGTAGLALSGGGQSVLTLGGANTYSGDTAVGVGSILKFGAAGVIPDASVITIANAAAATVDLNGFNETVKSIGGAGGAAGTNSTIALGANTLTLADDGETRTYTGLFTSTAGGKVVKSGTGTLTLGGSHTGFNSGEFHLKKGTLQLNVANSLGTFAQGTRLVVNPDANTGADAPTIRNGGNVTMSTKFLDIYGNFTTDLAAASNGSLQWLGGAATAPADWAATTITLKTANPEITVVNSSGNTTGVLIFFAKITDNFGTEGQARGFTKRGAGILSLQNIGDNATNGGAYTSNYKGDVTLMEGTLRLVHATTAVTNTTTRNNARNLETLGKLEQVKSAFGDGTGTLHLAGGNLVYTGAVMAPFASVEGGAVDLHVNDPRLMPVKNPVNVSGDVAIQYVSAAAQSPATDVTFEFQNNSIGGSSGTVTFNRSSATLNTYRPTFTGNGFNFSRPIVVTNEASDRATVLTSSNSTGTQTWSGVISGTGGFRRTTAGGTAVLTGANTFSGGTLVDGGTLKASGASATLGGGNVTVTGGNIEIDNAGANAIADSAILSLAGGGVAGVADVAFANLIAGLNDTIAGLILAGNTLGNGTYGSSTSGAANPGLAGLGLNPNEFFSGNGIVTVVSPGVPGDFNGNGAVDSADYVMWRKGGPLLNEVSDIGTVTPQDYTDWRARFGNTGAGSGAGGGLGGNAAVPEPASIGLVLLGLTTMVARRGRR